MKYKILLASQSPRRREILAMLKIPFTVVTIEGIDEKYPPDLEPDKVAEYIANKKADAFLKIINDEEMIITADTVVICDNQILGKPKGKQEAEEMLRMLSDKSHVVTTGVTVATKEKHISFTSATYVSFAPLSEDEIKFYVDTCHPYDKAGAYGIQEWIGAVAVKKIDGSFYNVMGLPVHQLYQVLKQF